MFDFFPYVVCLQIALLFGAASAAAAPAASADMSADVVVYGATPAGISAALRAARDGASVLVVDETHVVGGLPASGLSHTDFGTFQSISGIWREFMERVEQHYIQTYGPDSPQAIGTTRGGYFEPKVAEMTFRSMLEEAGVTVRNNLRLAAVEVASTDAGPRISQTTFVPTDATQGYPRLVPGGEPVTAAGTIFIDATYEGDLMAMAGVPYVVGEDAKSTYGEMQAPEEATPHVQCYNFRLTLTNDPSNRRPLPKPATYDRSRYSELLAAAQAGQFEELDQIIRGPVRPVPNAKADFNDVRKGSPVSLSVWNITDDWPDGSIERRQEIWQEAKDHALGLLWFLQHDEAFAAAVPEIAAEIRPWGLPKDEYLQSENWPPLLYVREGRRMLGSKVFTEHDARLAEGSTRAPAQIDGVAMGDYRINCHGTRKLPDGTRIGALHGGGEVNSQPFSVPYGSLVPREMTNLLVPVALSASHVGYQPIRMEPAWSSVGQAAGTAAAQAIRRGVPVQQVDVPALQMRLHEVGAMTLYISDIMPDSPYFRAAQFWGNRGFFQQLDESGIDPDSPWHGRDRQVPAQWGKGAKAHHAVKPNKAIDDDLLQSWLDRFTELYPEVPVPGGLVPDGKVTRGEVLQQLFEAVQKQHAVATAG